MDSKKFEKISKIINIVDNKTSKMSELRLIRLVKKVLVDGTDKQKTEVVNNLRRPFDVMKNIVEKNSSKSPYLINGNYEILQNSVLNNCGFKEVFYLVSYYFNNEESYNKAVKSCVSKIKDKWELYDFSYNDNVQWHFNHCEKDIIKKVIELEGYGVWDCYINRSKNKKVWEEFALKSYRTQNIKNIADYLYRHKDFKLDIEKYEEYALSLKECSEAERLAIEILVRWNSKDNKPSKELAKLALRCKDYNELEFGYKFINDNYIDKKELFNVYKNQVVNNADSEDLGNFIDNYGDKFSKEEKQDLDNLYYERRKKEQEANEVAWIPDCYVPPVM